MRRRRCRRRLDDDAEAGHRRSKTVIVSDAEHLGNGKGKCEWLRGGKIGELIILGLVILGDLMMMNRIRTRRVGRLLGVMFCRAYSISRSSLIVNLRSSVPA